MKKTILILATSITLLLSCTKDNLTNNNSSNHKLHADLWIDDVHFNIDKDWSVVNGKTYEEWVNSTSQEHYDSWLASLILNHPYMVTNAISDDKKDTFYINSINIEKGGINIGSFLKRNNKTEFYIKKDNDTLNLKLIYNNNEKYIYNRRIEFTDSVYIGVNNRNDRKKSFIRFKYR